MELKTTLANSFASFMTTIITLLGDGIVAEFEKQLGRYPPCGNFHHLFGTSGHKIEWFDVGRTQNHKLVIYEMVPFGPPGGTAFQKLFCIVDMSITLTDAGSWHVNFWHIDDVGEQYAKILGNKAEAVHAQVKELVTAVIKRQFALLGADKFVITA